jgi:hypothetical protein
VSLGNDGGGSEFLISLGDLEQDETLRRKEPSDVRDEIAAGLGPKVGRDPSVGENLNRIHQSLDRGGALYGVKRKRCCGVVISFVTEFVRRTGVRPGVAQEPRSARARPRPQPATACLAKSSAEVTGVETYRPKVEVVHRHSRWLASRDSYRSRCFCNLRCGDGSGDGTARFRASDEVSVPAHPCSVSRKKSHRAGLWRLQLEDRAGYHAICWLRGKTGRVFSRE